MESIETTDREALKQKIRELLNEYPGPISSSILEELIEEYDPRRKRRKTSLTSFSSTSLSPSSSYTVSITGFYFPSTPEKLYELAATQTHILLRDPNTNSIDVQQELKTLTTGICLPNPDKLQSYIFILFNENGNTVPIIFSTKGDVTVQQHNDIDIITGNKHDTICELLEETIHVGFIQPDKPNAFVKACLKGIKGYLFFLPIGIIFVFSKPMSYFPLESLHSIAIENVGLNTFDLAITPKPDKRIIVAESDYDLFNEKATVTFSMLNHSGYNLISHYVKQYQIANHSSPKSLMEIQMYIGTPTTADTDEEDEIFKSKKEKEYEKAEMEADKELQKEELHEFEDAEENGDD
jgi:hypothetical protein